MGDMTQKVCIECSKPFEVEPRWKEISRCLACLVSRRWKKARISCLRSVYPKNPLQPRLRPRWDSSFTDESNITPPPFRARKRCCSGG